MAFKLFRRKLVDREETSTALNRVLSTVDLTLLGIGSTLGIGVYVLAGSVAKTAAGPAVVISFFIAAFASVLAGLCYAEFGARVPKAGSAYVYSYVCVGELIAFIVGWNLIMEYVIGVASVAKGYSGYVDSLTNNHSMRAAFESIYRIETGFLASYFDFFAFGITLVLTIILVCGVKESSRFNNIFTSLNLLVVFFVIIAGAIYANVKNWTIEVTPGLNDQQCSMMPDDEEEHLNTTLVNLVNQTIDNLKSHAPQASALAHETKLGNGGFMPFGFSGVMKGAATCFYGFVGFDCIATTGEEAKNPQRAIPLAIVFSLLFIAISYVGMSTVLTMMVPYFCQDVDAPLPYAFQYVNFDIGKWAVIVGALFGLSTSLLGAMFPMPRVLYAMSSDGLLFGFFSHVHSRFQTPFTATLIGGVLGGLMAALFNLDVLIDMMSIGTLTAYTLVAICVLILRYRKDDHGADDMDGVSPSSIFEQPFSRRRFPSMVFNADNLHVPTEQTSSFSQWVVVVFCTVALGFCAVTVFCISHLEQGNPVIIAVAAVLLTIMITCLISLTRQPTSRVQLTFRVPWVLFISAVSIVCNLYLILELSGHTWIRFAVWMAIGFLIYFYCLFTGRTDRIYKEAYDSFHGKLSLKRRTVGAKVSIANIGNTTIELHSPKLNGNK